MLYLMYLESRLCSYSAVGELPLGGVVPPLVIRPRVPHIVLLLGIALHIIRVYTTKSLMVYAVITPVCVYSCIPLSPLWVVEETP